METGCDGLGPQKPNPPICAPSPQVHLRHLVGGRARAYTGEIPFERVFQVRARQAEGQRASLGGERLWHTVLGSWLGVKAASGSPFPA